MITLWRLWKKWKQRNEDPVPSHMGAWRDERLERLETPTLQRHVVHRWKRREESYMVWREECWCETAVSRLPLADLVQECEEHEQEEDRMAAVFETGDPLAPCREGWHVHEDRFWFRVDGVAEVDGQAGTCYLQGRRGPRPCGRSS